MPPVGRSKCRVRQGTKTARVQDAFGLVERGIMDLEQVRRDAEEFMAVQEIDWQDGPDGARYLAQLRAVSAAAAALGVVETPDVGDLR